MCSNHHNRFILGVIGSDGNKMPLHWFEKKPGKKGVDQAHYIEVSHIQPISLCSIFMIEHMNIFHEKLQCTLCEKMNEG